MVLIDYLLQPKTVMKYVGKGSGLKGWFLAISAGIISHGPIYVWYPLLKELRDQGMRSGLIAGFLYSRAIKIPLLPLLVYYFEALFVVVLLPYIVIASLIEGEIIELIESCKCERRCNKQKNMLANTIIKVSAISLAGTKGCARILFASQYYWKT